MAQPPWGQVFVDPDLPDEPATIRLRQVDRRTFALESALRYTGPTGVDDLPDSARTLRPEDLGPDALTDLATVPSALRWFVSPYGVHTPAALVHDRLVGPTAPPGVSDVAADAFFRDMLRALGVRFLRRWMMWTAVSFGTRWRAGGLRKAAVGVWVVLSIVGISTAGFAAVTGNLALLLIALAAPVLAAGLWGRQYLAGLIAAVTAVWVIPPTLLGAAGFGVYWLLENGLSALPVGDRLAGDEPVRYELF